MHIFQPFDPGDPNAPRRLRPLPEVPVRAVLPSLVTLVALCAGLTAIRMVIEGRFEFAIFLITIAAALDGVDGRIARLLRTTSRFGAELDSIADFVNFGVAPAILLYVWALNTFHSVGWIVALIFVICTALRLARFNVALGATDRPEWQAAYFVGMPAPAGAMTVMLPVYLELMGVPHSFLTPPVTLVYMLVISMLMVSQVPTFSGKLAGRRIDRDQVAPLFVAGVVVVAFLVSYPWETLTILTVAYLASLPVSWRNFERRKRAEGQAAKAG
jgi:CDP-diacylglycerol--serine O-phosphatidyltransferase